jgi:hypothetical protein
MAVRQALKTVSLITVLLSVGCSTLCPHGLKFGLYGAMCAPYESLQLMKSISEDLKPGGMLNPNGTTTEPSQQPEDTDDK